MKTVLNRGSIVRSLCGRDADSLLAVMEVCEPYVLLTDGKKRPVARPKRKKMKHTQLILTSSPLTDNAAAWTNRRVRETIRVAAEKADADMTKEDWHGKR